MMDDQTVYKTELHKAAAVAAEKATKALQKLVSTTARLIVADVETLEKPKEVDVQNLAERCIEYYKQDKVTISSQIKIYEENGDKKESGVMLMFLDKTDYHALGRLIAKTLKKEEERFAPGIEESAVTEALNIIGNAYIEVLANHFHMTLMAMVPEIVNTMKFDNFIGSIASESEDKLYMIFDTNLVITENIIRIPFLLAVAVQEN
jgi:chemotaxis protein CheY-P-specific phosphatase CheC